eukprot:3206805-Prymnesium_polylepis.1
MAMSRESTPCGCQLRLRADTVRICEQSAAARRRRRAAADGAAVHGVAVESLARTSRQSRR